MNDIIYLPSESVNIKIDAVMWFGNDITYFLRENSNTKIDAVVYEKVSYRAFFNFIEKTNMALGMANTR